MKSKLETSVKFLDAIKAFVSKNEPSHYPWIGNQWFKCRQMEVYLRRSRRVVGDGLVWVIDIANVGVKTKGKGVYSDFLEFIEVVAISVDTCNGLFIENILDEKQVDLYERRGYVKIEEFWPGCWSMIKILKRETK